MAKQSGLHQIRGKVGEHSYYKQTGVSAGLIRSINQGMSSRVKTAEEYANTRLNNSEFGGACSVAGALGKMVVPKFRPMILPFSQSNMAKKILEIAKTNVAPWGERVVTSANTPELAEILSEQSKRDPQEFVSLTAERADATTLTVGITSSATQSTLMGDLGIDRLLVKAVQIDLATGKYVAAENGVHKSYIRTRGENTFYEDIDPGTAISDTEDLTVAAFNPTPELYNPHQLVVFVVMPCRTIDSVPHVLQEYCSFYAMQMPSL